jgi:small GTP-binding protein
MIVGTAGHIDHGKTTLVRALTGVDTDRLPEEKKRGITIELGYAFMDGPEDQRVGFIDVPGHERLVHTMVSGATGIDLALLLVAADDGVMPQTREHLAVLSLLGIRHGLAVVTKCDRADAARVEAVQREVQQLLAESGFGPDNPVRFTIQTTRGFKPKDYEIIQAIVGLWRRVGIEAEIEVYEIAKHFELRAADQLAPAAFYNWGNSVGDPTTSTGLEDPSRAIKLSSAMGSTPCARKSRSDSVPKRFDRASPCGPVSSE